MKRLFFLFIFYSVNTFCYSQLVEHYYYTIENGKDPYMYYFRGLASHVVTAPVDDEISEVQTIPFEWSFFGTKVNQYLISDNGYITFNVNTTESISQNTELTDENVPKNSIFAFWTDLILNTGGSVWSNEVAVSTVGSEPGRVHVIYWMRVVPKVSETGSENISFFIALHEQGGFDIGYTVLTGNVQNKATVGAVNFDGSEYINIPPSPEYTFPRCGYGDADDECILVRENSMDVEENSFSDFSIFPNPASDYIEIKLCESSKLSESYNIKIYNILGECVSNLTPTLFKGEGVRIDVSCLPNGIYFIKLGEKIQKFAVIK